ncbi:hypothetical protein [Azospirillum sp.]|uniref:hypothetical protein n=1 Tax=Azospirillum sp. TaxID=34012 RepID=UPI002D391996|nr:hypothetical protein [Azospirillum sp.]HYD64588.1 hypothetical protein [Azospirillum sp.]
MAALTVPVLRFESRDACERAVAALLDQQFDVRRESDTEIGCTPWEDLEEARLILQAEGIACVRAGKEVPRPGPRRPGPVP